MVQRKIIKIDESLCNGCGSCVTACAEGAIEIVDGKARVISDTFCDGLGACIGECPSGAMKIVVREADAFDEEAAKYRVNQSRSSRPGLRTRSFGPSSQLSSWPIQMALAHADAPYFRDAKLLIASDCSAFANPSISDFIKGKAVLIGCPKLDETGPFVRKLAEILKANEIGGITLLYMEVPCCSNLVRLVQEAIRRSGKSIPVEQFICMIDGGVSKADKAP